MVVLFVSDAAEIDTVLSTYGLNSGCGGLSMISTVYTVFSVRRYIWSSLKFIYKGTLETYSFIICLSSHCNNIVLFFLIGNALHWTTYDMIIFENIKGFSSISYLGASRSFSALCFRRRWMTKERFKKIFPRIWGSALDKGVNGEEVK